MNARRVCGLVSLLVLGSPPPLLADWEPCSECWTTELVVSGVVGGWIDLKVDESGDPHIAYYSDSLAALMYATRTGATWQFEAVDYLTRTAGGPVSMALDGSGNVHVAYVDLLGSALVQKYATRSTSSWTSEIVDAGTDGSLALDGSGGPHIAYINPAGTFPTAWRLKYAKRTAGFWQQEFVDTTGGPGSPQHGGSPSLALDSTGSPHIAFSAESPNRQAYARRTGGDWIIEDVEEAPGGNLSRPSLTLDIASRPHICFNRYYSRSSSLRYAYRDAGGWNLEEAFGGSSNPFLVLDNAGTPLVSLGEGLSNRTAFGVHCEAGWVLEFVGDTSCPASQVRPLALDAEQQPHMVFLVSGNLIYGVRSAGVTAAPDPPPVDSRLVLRGVPNPFSSRTTIGYSLIEDATVHITVHDIRGRLVTMLVDGFQRAGERNANWNGRDDGGTLVPSGMYFVRVRAGQMSTAHRIVLTR